jgi:hypothetical protein
LNTFEVVDGVSSLAIDEQGWALLEERGWSCIFLQRSICVQGTSLCVSWDDSSFCVCRIFAVLLKFIFLLCSAYLIPRQVYCSNLSKKNNRKYLVK